MKKFLILLCAILFGGLLVFPLKAQTDSRSKSFRNPLNSFAFDSYAKLRESNGNENLIFSPYGISMAMATLYEGTNGETKEQIAKAMHFDKEENLAKSINDLRKSMSYETLDESFNPVNVQMLEISNSLWIEKTFPVKESYTNLLANSYDSSINPADFKNQPDKERALINDWVSAKTANKINDILPPDSLTQDTRLALVNTIYFKARWAAEFSERDTEKMEFRAIDGSKPKVDMMFQTLEPFYGERDDVQALRLYYVGNLSMFILLPPEGMLDDLERRLSTPEGFVWLDALSDSMSHDSEVKTWLPKFKTDNSFPITEQLKKLGISLAFSKKGEGDFSNITEAEALHVDNIIQKAFIDVNEKGTEAAAATAVYLDENGGFGAPPPPKPVVEFKADRPFLYLIVSNDSRVILFMGKFVKP